MRQNTKCPRILLADDFPLFLTRAEELLRNNYEILGFARDGGEALSLCLTLNPDLLLLDLSMPILCGLEVVTRLKGLGCKSKIVILTAQEDPDYVEAAFSLGASGYVLKSQMGTDLLPAIDAALNGSTFISPFPALVVAISPKRR